MNMQWDKLERTLIKVARNHEPSSSVPYAFEKRILARLCHELSVDPWSLWARALWKAAAPCLALVIVLSAWTHFSSSSAAPNYAKELEGVVLASFDQLGNSW